MFYKLLFQVHSDFLCISVSEDRALKKKKNESDFALETVRYELSLFQRLIFCFLMLNYNWMLMAGYENRNNFRQWFAPSLWSAELLMLYMYRHVANRGYAGQNFKGIKCWNCSWCCLHWSWSIVSCLFLLSALYFLSQYITSLLRHRLSWKQSWKYLKNNGQNFILISYWISQVLNFSTFLHFLCASYFY